MKPGLVGLYFKRVATPLRLVLVVLVLALVYWLGQPAEWIVRGSQDGATLRRSLLLQSLWTTALWLTLPFVLLHAARIAVQWRERERDWIASRPGARWKVIPTAWLGTLLGAVMLIGLIAVGAEVAAGAAPAGLTWKRHELQSGPPPGLVGKDGVRWSLLLDDDQQEVRARIRIALAPGDSPFATVHLRAERGGIETVLETVLTGRGSVELELPPGEGAVQCELSRVGTGARLLIREPRTELFVPAFSAHMMSVHLALRVLLLLAAALALLLGFASWMNAWLAALLVSALWLASWLESIPALVLPGHGLPELLSEMHDGHVAGLPGNAAWAGVVVCVLAGGGLAASRIWTERRSS